MLGILFLFFVFSNGFFINNYFLPSKDSKISLISFFVLGSLLSVTSIQVLQIFFHNFPLSIAVYFLMSLLALLHISTKLKEKLAEFSFKKEYILQALLFIFVFVLFQRSFSYDNFTKTFLISSNLFHDFGAHIPFARFFPNADNYIPEIPFFSNSGLTYHYFFDFYAGVLELLGIRLDIAVNLISALSLYFLFNLIFQFSDKLFKKRIVGVMASILLLFNSDLSFLQVIGKHGLSIQAIYNHNQYILGNFLGLGLKGNFLNVNVYLNQRHLILALLWFFSIIYIFLFLKDKLSSRTIILLGIVIGVFPYWHSSALISLYIVLFSLAIFFENLRKRILSAVLISLIFALPQLVYVKLHSFNQIEFIPGFIVHDALSIKNFLLFWIWNLGVAIPFIFFGFLKSNSTQRKIFLSFMTLFILGNLFKFSRDIFDNHKFFNIWIIAVNMYIGWGFLQVYKKNNAGKIVVVVAILLMTISGILHLLVVKNDVYARIPDYKHSKLVEWIDHNLPRKSIFLTNGDIYDPISIDGRRTFLGRPQFVFLYGGDPSHRIKQREKLLSGGNLKDIKNTFASEKIDYVIIYKKEFIINAYSANYSFFENNFKKIYEDKTGAIYEI